jgi:hypothetical protein
MSDSSSAHEVSFDGARDIGESGQSSSWSDVGSTCVLAVRVGRVRVAIICNGLRLPSCCPLLPPLSSNTVRFYCYPVV